MTTTRRDFLKIAGAAAGGVAIGATAGVLGASAFGVGRPPSPSPVNVYNWSFYIDDTLLDDFAAETGTRVVYDTFESVDDVWAKVANPPSGYDIAVLVDYRVADAIAGGLLLPVDANKIPNSEFLIDQFKAPSYDPTLAYSRAYFWGTTGIGYNRLQATIDGWAQLFDTATFLPAHNRRISMLDDLRETIGAALYYLGYSPNTEDPVELGEARDVLLAQKPFLAKFGGAADYMVSLVSGAWDASHAYNGDMVVAAEANADIAYVVPKEGANLWVDNMTIPRGARNVAGALKFMDFILEPSNQIRNALAAGYPSPLAVVKDHLPPDFTSNPAIYPTPEILAKCQVLAPVSPAAEAIYEQIWLEVTS